MMLTILHDEVVFSGRPTETASAEGVEVSAPTGATCLLARALMQSGFDPHTRTRLVKADPYLSVPPHQIDGLTLSLAAKIDFFGKPTAPTARRLPSPADPSRRA